MLDPFRPEQAEDVAHLKALQQEIHAMFIGLVRERRGTKLVGTDEELFSGAFWLAETAIGFGLADRLGDIKATLRARYGDKVRLKEVNAPRGFLARRLAGADANSLTQDVLAVIEERATWARFGL